MVLAGLAFVVAGFVQISVQAADSSLTSGHAKVQNMYLHECVSMDKITVLLVNRYSYIRLCVHDRTCEGAI